MKILKKIVVLIISILLINSLFISCYAQFIEVTDEKLNSSFRKIATSEVNSNDFEFTVSKGSVVIKSDGYDYNIKYDLTESPTFTLELPIKKGMTYDEFTTHSDNLLLPVMGYVAVADIQGVDIEDSYSYFLMSYLSSALGSGNLINSNAYSVVDDTQNSGITMNQNGNSKTIYASEFGDRVIEYVDSLIEDTIVLTDADEGINSYQFTIEKKDMTSDSCKLVTTLTVNTSADFSQLSNFSEELSNSFNNSGSLSDDFDLDNDRYSSTSDTNNNTNNTTNIVQTSEKTTNYNTNTDKTAATTTLPDAGINIVFYVLIASGLILLIIFGIKLKQYKDVK